MKKPLLLMALGLCTVLNSAYADTYDATLSGDGYQFSNSFSGSTAFDDYISFSTEGLQNIVASVSGTGSDAFSFDTFSLVDGDKNLVATGSVFNSSAHIAFGALETTQYGNFYLHVVGTSQGGTAGYNGTITNFVAAVPEPETYALMLSGLGIIGLIARRKMRDDT
ncbi:PEP-CTERM protein-sorting domain-containing protein [Methylophilus rhizosphaerae]|uniref:PEP-CTERM protein-sorting domain-containing protein n=1 Tax=Methylophilus rhizosphaerae TaxID=492660 RepID=A0A1G9BKS8_9PROT|nr:FxDxF family PEP-CTERM protein [Methylophilus rhizosphaerae]SDK39475.1 PEP-CTERM protein-sorting domain-containing protein [Methylophilus rhizosphaerae]